MKEVYFGIISSAIRKLRLSGTYLIILLTKLENSYRSATLLVTFLKNIHNGWTV